MITEEHIEKLIHRVLDIFPDATGVSVARFILRFGHSDSWGWDCTIDIPRRSKGKQKRRLHGNEAFRGSGETPEEAVEKAIQFVQWDKAGLLD